MECHRQEEGEQTLVGFRLRSDVYVNPDTSSQFHVIWIKNMVTWLKRRWWFAHVCLCVQPKKKKKPKPQPEAPAQPAPPEATPPEDSKDEVNGFHANGSVMDGESLDSLSEQLDSASLDAAELDSEPASSETTGNQSFDTLWHSFDSISLLTASAQHLDAAASACDLSGSSSLLPSCSADRLIDNLQELDGNGTAGAGLSRDLLTHKQWGYFT